MQELAMKMAVIGSSGQLGFDLSSAVPKAGHTLAAYSGRAELDICDGAAVARMLDTQRPDAVINTAAFHNVDLCEKEPEAAYRTNVLAVREMAKACEARGVWFVQIGTDYVMEGALAGAGEIAAARPLPETAGVCPKSIYAITRFGGDCVTLTHAPRFGFVVRSCGLFGVAGCKLKGGLNFVDTMIAAAKAAKPLRVVDDQIVAPTPTDELAAQLVLMIEHAAAGKLRPGLYHAVSHGQCSWYQFAKRALELWAAEGGRDGGGGGADRKFSIEPVPSSTYAAAAKRPTYSVLDNAQLRAAGLDRMGPWEAALERFVKAKYG